MTFAVLIRNQKPESTKKTARPEGLALRTNEMWGSQELLANRTGHRRKYVVRTASNQPDGANYQHQNHRQHDSIFGNVLALIIRP